MDTLNWRKSSHSGNGGMDCVEVARTPDGRIVARDSKAPNDGMLGFAPAVFGALLADIKRGRYEG